MRFFICEWAFIETRYYFKITIFLSKLPNGFRFFDILEVLRRHLKLWGKVGFFDILEVLMQDFKQCNKVGFSSIRHLVV